MYLTLHCHYQNDSLRREAAGTILNIIICEGQSRFVKQSLQTTTFEGHGKLKRAGTRTEVRRAGQPNTVPLGQTGLHHQQQNCSVSSFLLPPHPRPTVRCDPLAWRNSASPIATMYREASSATGSSLARPEDAARIFVRKLRNRLPQASVSAEFEKASVSERDRRRGVQTTENNTDRFALTRRS